MFHFGQMRRSPRLDIGPELVQTSRHFTESTFLPGNSVADLLVHGLSRCESQRGLAKAFLKIACSAVHGRKLVSVTIGEFAEFAAAGKVLLQGSFMGYE